MTLLELAERCEAARFPCPDDASAIELVAIKSALCHLMFGRGYDAYSPDFTGSLDAALTLLKPGNDWRRLTATSMSVYAASPYSATASVRYDGYGATPALQVCAAALKMLAAIDAKAIATEARRAATVKQGAVHEGAGPKDIAR